MSCRPQRSTPAFRQLSGSMSSFADYASYYDLFYRGKNYAAEAGFVMDVLTSHGCRPSRILELGCGTGAHAEHFARAGSRVFGVDLSERMVRCALDRFASLPAEISSLFQAVQADASDLVSPVRVDAVVSLFHVASYQSTNSALLGYFRSARSALDSGGFFLFDFWYGPAVLSDRPRHRRRCEVSEDGTEVVRETRPVMRCEQNVVDVEFSFMVGSVQSAPTFSETHRMRYLFLPEIQMLCGASGFALVEDGAWMTRTSLTEANWYGWAVLRAL